MIADAIQQRYLHPEAVLAQAIRGRDWQVSASRAYIQQRELLLACAMRDSAQKMNIRRYAPEQAVYAIEIAERLGYFVSRSLVAVEEFRSDLPAQSCFLLRSRASHRFELFFQKLFVVQVRVVAVSRDELFVRAQLDNLATMQHGDLVGVPYG